MTVSSEHGRRVFALQVAGLEYRYHSNTPPTSSEPYNWNVLLLPAFEPPLLIINTEYVLKSTAELVGL